jgi:hypothetical protein
MGAAVWKIVAHDLFSGLIEDSPIDAPTPFFVLSF